MRALAKRLIALEDTRQQSGRCCFPQSGEDHGAQWARSRSEGFTWQPVRFPGLNDAGVAEFVAAMPRDMQ